MVEAEKVRRVQIDHLVKFGYTLNEVEVPVPDQDKLKFGKAILVDYTTSILEQLRLLGIEVEEGMDLSRLYDYDTRIKPVSRWAWIYGADTYGFRTNESLIEESLASGKFITDGRHRLEYLSCEGLAYYRENLEFFKESPYYNEHQQKQEGEDDKAFKGSWYDGGYGHCVVGIVYNYKTKRTRFSFYMEDHHSGFGIWGQPWNPAYDKPNWPSEYEK